MFKFDLYEKLNNKIILILYESVYRRSFVPVIILLTDVRFNAF